MSVWLVIVVAGTIVVVHPQQPMDMTDCLAWASEEQAKHDRRPSVPALQFTCVQSPTPPRAGDTLQ